MVLIMIFDKCKNSLQRGAVGLARAIYEYQKLGYVVCVPVVDGQDYDLVVEIHGKFYSVQVRTTSQKARNDKRVYTASLRSIKTNCSGTVIKNRGVYDLLFVLCDDGTCYSIPTPNLPQSMVTLNEKMEVFKLP